jgi:hypothetical protein
LFQFLKIIPSLPSLPLNILINKMLVHPHLVFGYGSLICLASRAITAPSVAGRGATPVTVQNVKRTWAKQSLKLTATSMGVRFRDGAKCAGALVPVLKLHVCGVDLCAVEATESVNTLTRVVLS